MAKKDSDKKAGATSKGPAKQTGKSSNALARPAARGEDKHSSAPRGTVSTKPVGRLRTFFREVRVEMKKVTWPPRKELIKSTGVVMVAVVVAAAYIGAFDALWNWLVKVAGMVG
jgi:preprotein translocase subunit SecE